MSCNGIPNSNFWRFSNVWRPSHAWRQRTISGCLSPNLPWLLLMRPIINNTLFGSFHVFVVFYHHVTCYPQKLPLCPNVRKAICGTICRTCPARWDQGGRWQTCANLSVQGVREPIPWTTISWPSPQIPPGFTRRYMSNQNVFNEVSLMKCL